MSDTPDEQRTEAFRWNSRFELYEYFKKNFTIDKKNVDKEIHAVMATFRPRKHKAIKTQELWQKVGLNLEDKNISTIEVVSPKQEMRGGDVQVSEGES